MYDLVTPFDRASKEVLEAINMLYRLHTVFLEESLIISIFLSN